MADGVRGRPGQGRRDRPRGARRDHPVRPLPPGAERTGPARRHRSGDPLRRPAAKCGGPRCRRCSPTRSVRPACRDRPPRRDRRDGRDCRRRHSPRTRRAPYRQDRRCLNPGDTVAVVSPASAVGSRRRARPGRMVAHGHGPGAEIRPARGRPARLSGGHRRGRAADLNAAYADPRGQGGLRDARRLGRGAHPAAARLGCHPRESQAADRLQRRHRAPPRVRGARGICDDPRRQRHQRVVPAKLGEPWRLAFAGDAAVLGGGRIATCRRSCSQHRAQIAGILNIFQQQGKTCRRRCRLRQVYQREDAARRLQFA